EPVPIVKGNIIDQLTFRALMKQNSFKRLVLALLFSLAGASIMAHPIGVASERILVKAKRGTHSAAVADAILPYEGQEVEEISGTGVKVVHVPTHGISRALDGLKHHQNIEFAEPDRLLAPDFIANDPHATLQWHLAQIPADTAR